MPDVALLDAKIAEAERAIAEGETTGEKRRAMERREDLMRLKRVEQIYVRTLHPERGVVPCLAHAHPSIQSAVLPVLSGWVLVLLKLLLATASTVNGGGPPPAGAGVGFPPGVTSRECCATLLAWSHWMADDAQRSIRRLRSLRRSTRQM